MTRWGLLAACAFIAAPSMAAAEESPAPKLIVAISVDQFSADLFDEYRPYFRGGLGRIASGTSFHNGYQSHNMTETCPGHSTILTGDHPSRTGIISNEWIDQSIARDDKSVYCAEDERVEGSSSQNYTVSPVHLRVPTLGDYLKKRFPGSRTVAVAGKDRAAVMMTGQKPDQRWYWDGKAYTTDIKSNAAPASVTAANQAVAALIAQAQPGLEPPGLCAARSRAVPIEGTDHTVGNGRFERTAGDSTKFRASPEFDGATLALAASLVGEMKLGQSAQPDLIAIGLSATDYVGHTYGTEGQEMCLQLMSLDRDLGDLLSYLDGAKVNYEVVLTADHGGNDTPERERDTGIPDAARAVSSLGAAAMGKVIGEKLGLSGPILLGDNFGDIYVSRNLPEADRTRVKAAAMEAYRSHPQVAAVFTHEELAQTPVPSGDPVSWNLKQRARASFDDARSGDLVVLLKPRVTPITDPKRYVATHGSPYDYDRRVPILFYRPGQPAEAIERPVETVDIMPTLSAQMDVPLQPGEVDGKCLAEVAGAACPR